MPRGETCGLIEKKVRMKFDTVLGSCVVNPLVKVDGAVSNPAKKEVLRYAVTGLRRRAAMRRPPRLTRASEPGSGTGTDAPPRLILTPPCPDGRRPRCWF